MSLVDVSLTDIIYAANRVSAKYWPIGIHFDVSIFKNTCSILYMGYPNWIIYQIAISNEF